MYVQKVDDDGVVSLEPYKKATHGAFETRADYQSQGGITRQPIVDPRTGFTTGYIILDRNGNEIRREMFGAQSAGAGAGTAPQGTAPATKDKKSRPSLGSLMFPGSQQ